MLILAVFLVNLLLLLLLWVVIDGARKFFLLLLFEGRADIQVWNVLLALNCRSLKPLTVTCLCWKPLTVVLVFVLTTPTRGGGGGDEGREVGCLSTII